ncbi:hypothetical protein CDL15_Pgr022791 [Punica granatum]|uniref:FMR1-interacting protein 1 conserved domain-containing protein n=1 Tax=Punica granatum TaxID=22663 RepID=A0A218XS94_PUNGR|nr:hypothetical protein CDL15_Pgr022791 [Punica granatum]
MYPGFNPFPHRPNQFPGNPSSQQVVPSDQSIGNAPNMPPNGMQVQPQMGFYPQNAVALNGLMTQLSNAPNHLLHLQSNQLAMQQLMGFSSQNNAQALHAVPGQFFNMGQNANLLNLLRPLSGNMVLPNLQYSMPNAMLNVNQLLAMQMLNPAQVPHYNGPPCPNQAMGPDCLRQQINQSQQNFSSSTMGANGLGPLAVASQQLQENHAAIVNPHSDQAKGSPKFPSSLHNTSQENHSSRGGENTANFNSKFQNFPRKEFTRNPRTQGFQKSHFHHIKNGKRKFDYADGLGGKETNIEKAQKYGSDHPANQANERKRVSIAYTVQEIKQWREERRRNHPSNSTKKKQMESKIDETDDSKARREQLKEILAKQVELGVEVADIPSHYLAESENKVPGREENRRPFSKKHRCQNKHDKRRKNNQRERFSKKQRSEDTGPQRAPPSLERSEPTLLKKLLSKDIRKDKLRLLQVFRFMAMNNFFKDEPEQPLKFPSVIINENGTEGSPFEEKASVVTGGDLEAGSEKCPDENLGGSFGVDDGSISDDAEDGADDDDRRGVHHEEEEEEEEGEITD